jgi:hypothetical protein
MAEDYVHKPIDILELQLCGTTLQNEILMRYVTSPKNLGTIRNILTEAMDKLSLLKVAEGEEMCPDGWIHLAGCRCIAQPIQKAYKE